MSLRPLLEIAAESERLHALAGDARAAADGGEALSMRTSATLRPLLLASLLEDERGLARRATWPPTCAPTWRRGGSASTPRAAPATPPM
jgi:hypothetical protein